MNVLNTVPVTHKTSGRQIGYIEICQLPHVFLPVYYGYTASGHLVGYSSNRKTMEQRVRSYLNKRGSNAND